MSICVCCDPAAEAAAEAAHRADTTPPMGREPAAPGCRCHLCAPPPPGTLDRFDQRSVEKIWRHGWQVIAVEGDAGPDFAYTVGLPHRVGHPELLMSGLDLDLMGGCLNRLAARIIDGVTYTPGAVVEGALAGVPVLLERVRSTALADTVCLSRWFHRRRVDALQVVWPDTSARFAWQPGAPAEVRALQPASWRVRSRHVGMLAPDPVWPLATPADSLAVVCTHIVDDGAVPLCIARHVGSDGDDLWTAQCTVDHAVDPALFITSHLAHLVRATPSMAQLADLPSGAWAARTGPDAPWQQLP